MPFAQRSCIREFDPFPEQGETTMVTVNPEPVKKGKYSPLYRVTAIYGTPGSLHPIIRSLQQAGFVEQEIDVFIGEEGAEQLDLGGKKLGAVVRFLRDL